MPQVPRRKTGLVQEQPLQTKANNFDTSPESFGGGLGKVAQAASGLANQVVALDREETKRADDRVNVDTNNKLLELEDELYHNKDNGALNAKGENSLQAYDDSKAGWASKVSELRSKLTSDRQKEYLDALAEKRAASIDKGMQGHMGREMQKVDLLKTKALVSNSQARAVEYYNQPDEIADSIATQEISIRDMADRNGLPIEAVQSQILDAKSKTHSMVVSRMLDNDEEHKAEDYFKKNSDNLTANDKIKVEKMIEVGILRKNSQQNTESIMNKGLSEAESLKIARNNKNSKEADATAARVKTRFKEMNAETVALKKQNFELGEKILVQSGSLDNVPPSVLSSMSPKEIESLRKTDDQMARGVKPSTDELLRYKLLQQAGDPATKDLFIKTNLAVHKPDLSKADYDELLTAQNDLREGKAPKGIQTRNQIINNSLRAVNIKVGSKASKEDLEKTSKYYSEVERIVAEKEISSGKKASNAEVREIADNLMVDIVTHDGFFWDTTKRAFELTPEEEASVQIQNVPPEDRSAIEAVIRKKGGTVSDDSVARVWINLLKGKKKVVDNGI